ncbi:MAG TPA: TRAP transporter small permease [Ramlibacter sp.]|nr:TRAP transporter small permease [Ramlibacter sp.]
MEPAYVRLMDRLYLACIWLSGAAIFLMSVIIPWGVFSRYVLGRGSAWPEPIAILLMVVFTFIGAAAGYRANAHIAVTLLTDVLPGPLKRLAAVAVDALMGIACLFVTWYGARLVMETMRQSLAELPWMPVGVTYLALPLGSLATLLFVIERVLHGPQDRRWLVSGEPEVTPEAAVEGAR